MKNFKNIILSTALIASVFLFTAQSCKNNSTLKALGEVLIYAWYADGNATLIVDTDDKKGIYQTVPLDDGDYEESMYRDIAFFNEADIIQSFGSTNLDRFKLICGGSDNGADLATTIVFWSEPNWQGTKTVFKCGGDNNSYEIENSISTAKSICIVTETMDSRRISRCINGPRCDDWMENQNESDVDCGGPCTKCRSGQECEGSNNNCQSGDCYLNRCRTPSCNDTRKNGSETDVDCGGSNCQKCAINQSCNSDRDCVTGNCESGTCRPKRTCNNSYDNGNAQYWTVYLEAFNSCILYKDYFANSFADAKSCAESEGYGVPGRICNYRLSDGSNYYPVVAAASPNKALQCAAYTMNSNWTVIETGGCVNQ